MTRSASTRADQRTVHAIERITSLQNERIKSIRALDMRKVRREAGVFVAEGASILIAARARGHVPETILTRDAGMADGPVGALLTWAQQQGSRILEVSDAILEKVSGKDNPQTLIGVFRQGWARAPDVASLADADTWIALEAIRDPGNLGTIIRTADAAGARGIILAGTCCDPFARECVRATMGSIFAVPLARASEDELRALMARWPGDTVATHLDGPEDFRGVAYRAPTLLVMGSEGPGLSAAIAAACSRRVKIPMAPGIDSLNLAIATALTLYQIRAPWLALRPRDGRG